jgi:hypothetical protein
MFPAMLRKVAGTLQEATAREDRMTGMFRECKRDLLGRRAARRKNAR